MAIATSQVAQPSSHSTGWAGTSAAAGPLGQSTLEHASAVSPATGPVPQRRASWSSVAVGLTVGTVVAGVGAWVILQQSAGPAPLPQTPIAVNVDSLPQTVMGRTRSDLELKDLRPAQAQTLRELATASVSRYAEAFGGDGIKMSYGLYAAKELTLVAVNGQLNPRMTQPVEQVEHLQGFGPYPPIAVAGTATTVCAYSPKETVGLDGRTARVVLDEVLGANPADGTLTCTRWDPARNFSVELTGASVASTPPSEAAADMAAAVDETWSEMVRS